MSDREFRKEDRARVIAGAEALHRVYEEVANLTVEDNEGQRERIIGLLNAIGQNFSDIGDQIEKDFKSDEDAKAEASRKEADDKSAKAGR